MHRKPHINCEVLMIPGGSAIVNSPISHLAVSSHQWSPPRPPAQMKAQAPSFMWGRPSAATDKSRCLGLPGKTCSFHSRTGFSRPEREAKAIALKERSPAGEKPAPKGGFALSGRCFSAGLRAGGLSPPSFVCAQTGPSGQKRALCQARFQPSA